MILVEHTIDIAAPASLVRAQFGDVAHHQRMDVHNGVTFEVLADSADRCRYRQRSRTGPFTTSQELELERRPDGLLVNTIQRGRFRNAAIVFEVTEIDAHRSAVAARFTSNRLAHRTLRPVIARLVGSALKTALTEDRDDLEAGRYAVHDTPDA